MDRKATKIQDVARVAGVSTATVSRAISNPEIVSEVTREAVFEAIRTTGYHINLMARNLRRKRTGAIVVLVPNLGNPFFSRILSGIEQTAAAEGLSVLIVDTKHPDADQAQLVSYLHNTRADGLIALDGSLPRALLGDGQASSAMPPIVFACEWIADSSFPNVAIDNEAGAAMAVRHLHELGHRNIGHVTGPSGNVLTETRLAGTRKALASLGLDIRDEWFIDGDFSLQSGADAARQWLAMEERPTALFCASDQMACGFISELSQEGLSVPGDVSIVGFDDIDIARRFIPPLTTIHQPRNAIGNAAARLLIEQISGDETEAASAVHQVLGVELVVRKSTAPLA
ncbi:LacI family DNA-binding transcriptional regulator [Nitratireductor thuwali]|uniref:HTH-type transcriptional repressor CytR n=1 Tax=Nitratireductor thuwali TaxID=2267699 RepID=A0ABY5MKR3_9HYPH|nr:HTH-type transcriptional repressor CytR [Nitratireductor thuwali]